MATIYQAQNIVVVTLGSSGVAAGASTLVLATGDGANLASTAASAGSYPLTIWDSTLYHSPHDDPNAEIVLVTSHDGASDTIATISKGQEGTSDANHNTSGHTYKAVAGFTKAMFDNLVLDAQEDGSSVIAQANVLNFANGPDVTNPSTNVAKIDYSVFGGFPRRPFHIPSTFNNSKVSRKLYYPHYGSGYFGATTVNFSMTIYFTYFYPFIAERSGTVDELFIVRSGASTAGGRIGIYDTVSATDLSPGLALYRSNQLTLSSLGSTSDARWNVDPSASVTFKKGKFYWLAGTLSATQNVNGINATVWGYPPFIGADWQDVSTLNLYNNGNIGLGAGTSYYEVGLPADMTAVSFSNLGAAAGFATFWMHWKT